jgi:hypothetical protein
LYGDVPAFISKLLIPSWLSGENNLISVHFCQQITGVIQLTPKVKGTVTIVLMSFYPTKGPGEWRSSNFVANIGQKIK